MKTKYPRRSKGSVSTVAVAHASQVKVVLNKTTSNPLLSGGLPKAVAKTVAAIDRALIAERRFTVNMGGLLSKLKSEIATHLEGSGQSSSYQAKVVFHNFVKIRFKLGEVRSCEFMRLAERKDLHRLALPTSVLIELCRLDSSTLKQFMKKNPTAKLKLQTVKEIKKLVRTDNSKKRTSKVSDPKTKEQATDPKSIAEKLKSTFEQVRVKFGSDPTLDKSLDTVLGDISMWYFGVKKAA